MHIKYNKEYYNNYFDYKIRTDGVSCGLIFIRKDLFGKTLPREKKMGEEKSYRYIDDLSDSDLIYLREKVNIIGCDPGKRNLVTMIDSTGSTLGFTSVQRQHESKATRCKEVLRINMRSSVEN